MNFVQGERTAAFIDGPNLHATLRALDFEIDFRRMFAFFNEQTRLIRCFYYTSISDSDEYSSIRPLVDWLDYNGFTTRTKPSKEYLDGEGRRKIKSNMDVELAVDALSLAPSVDHIMIFSGNGGFRYLVEALQQMGKRVSVISTLETQPALVADELRRQADQFVELARLEELIGRSRTPPNPTSPARSVAKKRARSTH
jgi:uncharacterized LabA/DUF88 family protein